jgi:hypothetical protein
VVGWGVGVAASHGARGDGILKALISIVSLSGLISPDNVLLDL